MGARRLIARMLVLSVGVVALVTAWSGSASAALPHVPESTAAGATFAAPAVTASAGSCPNEQRREEQNVTGLPECRAYEMVSPLDKNGTDVVGNGLMMQSSVDGERVTYGALAGFSETSGTGGAGITQYVASRHEGEGWTSRGITPTPALESFQFLAGSTLVESFSSDFSHAVVEGYNLPGGHGGIPFNENYYLEDTESGSLQTITTPLGPETPPNFSAGAKMRAASSDLGVVTFETEANMLPETTGSQPKLYAWEHGTLKLAGVLPDGTLPAGGSTSPIPGFLTTLENQLEGGVSSDGSRILFVSPASGGEPQLYMRKNGNTTAWISEPEMASAPAEPSKVTPFRMTPDGKDVLFATADRLLSSDPGTSQGELGLYIYKDGPEPQAESNLTFVARVDFSEAFRLDGAVLGMSEDGKRIYFYTNATPGFAEKGIYLWDEGAVHFVAPTGNDMEIAKAEVSATGRSLAFLSEEHLGGAAIEGEKQEMYVYDEEGETLTCASCVQTGGPTASDAEVVPKANAPATVTVNVIIQPRFLSSDGQRVFFSTAASLVPQDTNGLSDVYEYDVGTGAVSLLSTGTGEDGAWFTDASPSGDDVFMVTRQSLMRSDTDSLVDLYDVRINGGFPQPSPETGGCEGDECQGTPSAGPSFNTASGFSGLGNTRPAAKPTVKVKTLTRAQKLARALKACKRKPKKQRERCTKRARKAFGAKKAHNSTSARARR